ncbi:MAG TPA: GIY-YIG nuclease family protein [candidate division Zixibacteria bacterium]|nr:GIY-YIG nuclease family protein [candidate division Zixibacteria bacterium]
MFYVYIIQSQKTGTYYVGSCSRLALRIERHNLGWNKSTKNKGPRSLKYREMFESRNEAISREKEIKRKKSRIYIEKLIAKITGEVVPI